MNDFDFLKKLSAFPPTTPAKVDNFPCGKNQGNQVNPKNHGSDNWVYRSEKVVTFPHPQAPPKVDTLPSKKI